MAMIKCPECGNDVSDKALSCPKCGCPINNEKEVKKEEEEKKKEAKREKDRKTKIFLAVLLPILIVAFFVVKYPPIRFNILLAIGVDLIVFVTTKG